ncbi:MAG: glucose-6-phosphate isomerase family protein [Silvibacterium sp.]
MSCFSPVENHEMFFDTGLDISLQSDPFGFVYGCGVFGPSPELRTLDTIRPSLRDQHCDGPDPVYVIAMDVGRLEHIEELKKRMLLFGVVAYANGKLGEEPVRSQGHVHAVAPHCGWSTPELIEIWQGRALVYLQEYASDDPGRCIAIEAGPGDQVVAPPGWAHCVINADVNARMVFGAWCCRQYGFLYDEVRAHGGLAWFPIVQKNGDITWEPNENYSSSTLSQKRARSYPELGIARSIPIYEQFAHNPDSIRWVSDPATVALTWKAFEA